MLCRTGRACRARACLCPSAYVRFSHTLAGPMWQRFTRYEAFPLGLGCFLWGHPHFIQICFSVTYIQHCCICTRQSARNTTLRCFCCRLAASMCMVNACETMRKPLGVLVQTVCSAILDLQSLRMKSDRLVGCSGFHSEGLHQVQNNRTDCLTKQA
jgi:hypothetical protein